MTNPRNRHLALAKPALSFLMLAMSAVALGTDEPEDDPGVRVTPKPHKMYAIGDDVVPFTELEARLTTMKPARIVVEASREPKGAACAIILGVQLGVPVWTRSYNGRMKHLQIDADAKDVKSLEKCR